MDDTENTTTTKKTRVHKVQKNATKKTNRNYKRTKVQKNIRTQPQKYIKTIKDGLSQQPAGHRKPQKTL